MSTLMSESGITAVFAFSRITKMNQVARAETSLKLVFQILLLLGSIKARGQAAAYQLAKSGCQEKCGNVSIPFPFGIGPADCFLDQWYEIVCQNGTNTPRLKKLDLQVLNISVTGGRGDYGNPLQVNFPVIYSKNCSRNHTRKSVTMEGSPFLIAEEGENVFVAAGCNGVVLIENTESAVVGCKLSGCSSGRIRTSTNSTGRCSGSSCCQTTTPSGLQSFILSFRPDDEASGAVEGCTYAMLVDQQRFDPLLVDAWELEGYAPALLYWFVTDDKKGEVFYNFTNNGSYGETYECTHDSGYLPETIIACYCRYGYAGNAYLFNGCKDINEREDPDTPDICLGRTCINGAGGHHCVDAKRTVRLVMIGIGSALGALLLLAFIWWLYKAIKRRRQIKRKEKYFKRNGGLILQQQLSSPEGNVEKNKLINSRELEKATHNFSEDRILGRGSQGTVFKGMLMDGRIVAIKKSMAIDEGFVEQFINEVVILSQINHRNIVKLLGCCLETKVPLLVYEFIPNGTLYQYLHEPNEEFPVSWEVRLRIACEVAGALSYLHSAASLPIYHRDIKTTNILLDDKYRAKVADFGTARSVSLDQTHVTTLVQGTFGYLDPEYFQSSQFTDKSDVYSFGVVLVELLTGQKPVSSSRAEEGRSLATYLILSMDQNCLFEILDAQVLNQAKKEDVMAVADVAKRCLHLYGRNRPTMREVAMELEVIRNPRQPQYVLGNEERDRNAEAEAITGDDVAFTLAEAGADPDIISMSDTHPPLFCDSSSKPNIFPEL